MKFFIFIFAVFEQLTFFDMAALYVILNYISEMCKLPIQDLVEGGLGD